VERYVRQKSNSVLNRIVKKLVVFIILFVIPILLFLYSFNIKQVEIVGAEHYKAEQIKELVFNKKLDSNSLYLYLKYNYFGQPQFPFIEKIDIKLVKPSHVKLFVYEKMVAGCVEMMGEYFYFDKDGIVVESSADKLDKVHYQGVEIQ
jgi:cell division protein FtsQ